MHLRHMVVFLEINKSPKGESYKDTTVSFGKGREQEKI